jgi:hypothetical protein
VDPVPDPLLFFLVVPGIEPGPPDLQPRTLTTRPQRLELEHSSQSRGEVKRGGTITLLSMHLHGVVRN